MKTHQPPPVVFQYCGMALMAASGVAIAADARATAYVLCALSAACFSFATYVLADYAGLVIGDLQKQIGAVSERARVRTLKYRKFASHWELRCMTSEVRMLEAMANEKRRALQDARVRCHKAGASYRAARALQPEYTSGVWHQWVAVSQIRFAEVCAARRIHGEALSAWKEARRVLWRMRCQRQAMEARCARLSGAVKEVGHG